MAKDKTGSDKAVSRSGTAVPAAAAAPASSGSEIAAFLNAAKSLAPGAAGSGRLAFALDATMSRQPTWDSACKLQAEMFDAVGKTAQLSVQLVYFRGLGECRASRWVTDTTQLANLMTRIACRGGQTQIGRVLRHVADEAKLRPVSALVYIGDAMEEDIDKLAVMAGELALRKVPCFMFHEGHDPAAARGFREIARVTGGAYVRFDQNAAAELAALLRAVATYATGGRPALEKAGGAAATLLLEQLGPARTGGKGQSRGKGASRS
ncbi:VWA domain-containing protein [Hoeflea sp.]|uniref:VWA domain-containing protein n=1 Tax=Hoeflea sp. TaxID=1940281 RepID=UPI0019B86A87|nr:VWA domain-containing protein [Hoeflea sp.]MBC7281336.1 VWA domain-containing protein [Hoeflea sp.]